MYCNYLYLFKLPSFVLNEKEKMGIVDNNVKIRKKTQKYAQFCILVGFPINETII